MALKDPRGGPVNRPLKYGVKILVAISEDAHKDLMEMAKVRGAPVATLARRAVMKDIYIYKAEKAKRKERGMM